MTLEVTIVVQENTLQVGTVAISETGNLGACFVWNQFVNKYRCCTVVAKNFNDDYVVDRLTCLTLLT